MEMEEESRKLRESMAFNVEAARERAEKKAAAIVAKAEKLSRLLSELGDGTLNRIIAGRIGRIFPGSDHDIQDVQS